VVEVTARVHHSDEARRVVGLSRAPSMAFVPHNGAYEVPSLRRLQTDGETGCATPMNFTSTSKARSLPYRSRPPPSRRGSCTEALDPSAASSGLELLSWGCPKSPSIDTSRLRPVPVVRPRAAHIRPKQAIASTPSALVVPPDFDGFLRIRDRRSVAPCSRS
jgi:hypothetical protein